MELKIKGKPIDEFTRCVHYHNEFDVMAIKFKCCLEFYPCFECHEETANHPAEVWPKSQWNENAVLCGRCKRVMSILDYLESSKECIHCNGAFNPECANHYHLYFDMKSG